ncbi:hypothetical protein C0Q70_02087 [Pomacea canaliculata]|uniref:Uncharacterized protein n=1 Tax=Pomacea canaliculata TaxID=400727 RepID=A0A2T7Q1A9_POMCA|nr:hypothetical protein C0Q70_02087 [Pomacea canaliculata]
MSAPTYIPSDSNAQLNAADTFDTRFSTITSTAANSFPSSTALTGSSTAMATTYRPPKKGSLLGAVCSRVQCVCCTKDVQRSITTFPELHSLAASRTLPLVILTLPADFSHAHPNTGDLLHMVGRGCSVSSQDTQVLSELKSEMALQTVGAARHQLHFEATTSRYSEG